MKIAVYGQDFKIEDKTYVEELFQTCSTKPVPAPRLFPDQPVRVGPRHCGGVCDPALRLAGAELRSALRRQRPDLPGGD